MQRHLRLRHRRDFARLRHDGQVAQHRLLKLSYAPSGLPHHRYGFIVSGRLGNAVRRNKLRRRLREIVRVYDQTGAILQPHADHQIVGHDVIIIAKPSAVHADFDTLQQAVKDLLQRAKLTR